MSDLKKNIPGPMDCFEKKLTGILNLDLAKEDRKKPDLSDLPKENKRKLRLLDLPNEVLLKILSHLEWLSHRYLNVSMEGHNNSDSGVPLPFHSLEWKQSQALPGEA
jgi:hypothetical protein